MAVHFKFRSAVAFDSLCVEGNGITIGSLKDKIIEQKNLGRNANFDLIITNAESGEEYKEDTFLVPKNTSVIIKRVPGKFGKNLLLVNEHEQSRLQDDALDHPPSRSIDKVTDLAQLALTSSIDELYDMDDFGVDLYAVDESALTHVETDEMSNASGFVAKPSTDLKRCSRENESAHGHGKDGSGLSYRAVPHAGYICRKCGLAGHFIQHCPNNGEPSYDMEKGSRGRADREDLSAVSQPNGIVTNAYPLPPELQCSLCQKVFKEAVMIPCCQYSFCDSCVKQYLLEKGRCPQCGSDRFKIEDLLPNVALRQTIERFTSTVLDTTVPTEGADVESATKAAKVVSPATHLHQTSSVAKDLTSMVMVENQVDAPVVDDSVCESAINSKENVVHEGSKIMPLYGEYSSAGKTKQKPFSHPSISEMLSEHLTGKSRKVTKYCFVCGSPDHIARNCTAYAGDNTTRFPSQIGVFRPLGAVPRAISPFAHQMLWPGPMTYRAPPLPIGPYCPLPYGAAALPVAPYGVSSFTPPMYPNSQLNGFLNGIPGRVVPPGERPLSREEFLELQEREHKRRLALERRDRELSQGRPGLSAESEEYFSSDSEHTQRHIASKFQGNSRRCDAEIKFSEKIGNTKNKHKFSKQYCNERVQEYGELEEYDQSSGEDPTIHIVREPVVYSHRLRQGIKPVQSVIKKANIPCDFSPYFDHEECQHAKLSGLKEEPHLKLKKHISVGRMDCSLKKHEQRSYVKHDGTRVSEAGAAEMLRSSRHGSRTVLEGPRMIYLSQLMEVSSEIKDRHNHQGLVSDDVSSFEDVDDPNSRKHQIESSLGMLGPSVGGTRRKKRRKHKKCTLDEPNDVSMEEAITEGGHKKLSKKQKCHHTASLVDKTNADQSSLLDFIDESRWQMYVGLGDESTATRSCFKERLKHKHHRSTKSALQKL